MLREEIWAYVRSFRRQAAALLTGAGLAAFTFFEALRGKTEPQGVMYGVSGVLLWLATYRAWSEEYGRRRKVETDLAHEREWPVDRLECTVEESARVDDPRETYSTIVRVRTNIIVPDNIITIIFEGEPGVEPRWRFTGALPPKKDPTIGVGNGSDGPKFIILMFKEPMFAPGVVLVVDIRSKKPVKILSAEKQHVKF